MNRKYTTVLGDMWDTIAYKTLGNEKYTDKLIKNNLQHRHTAIFSAGVVIDIPEIEAEVLSELPPWKRGKEGPYEQQ